MNDSLDTALKSAKQHVELTNPMTDNDRKEFFKLQEKQKNDEQWRKMRLLFNKPLVADLNKYTMFDDPDEEDKYK